MDILLRNLVGEVDLGEYMEMPTLIPSATMHLHIGLWGLNCTSVVLLAQPQDCVLWTVTFYSDTCFPKRLDFPKGI